MWPNPKETVSLDSLVLTLPLMLQKNKMNNGLSFCLLHVIFIRNRGKPSKKSGRNFTKTLSNLNDQMLWSPLIGLVFKKFVFFWSKWKELEIGLLAVTWKFKLFCHLLSNIFHYIFVLVLLFALVIKTREFSHYFWKLLIFFKWKTCKPRFVSHFSST